ncbi:DUF4082 domain-containing protein [Actinoplanes sp. NPDC051851]|uniref:DUF4082 domain-containing protein n=1 Tax=Actinoplanes sp. NPDC051851 TaxID=3154753 RepID=UPI003439C63C
MTLIIAGAIAILTDGTAAVAACASANQIVCENAKTGSPASEWDITGAGDETLQGFSTDMSVDAGETIKFKVRAEHAYTIAVYRLGYYGGDGARKIETLTGTFPAQNTTTPCVTDATTLIYDCGTWAVSASWTPAADAVSGVYFALLTRTDTGGASHITFVVRNDDSHSDVLFKTSDATWQAYNLYGGADFYQDNGRTRAQKLSYNRPYATRGDNNGRDFLFSNEYPAIRFMERNGYDVTYTSDVDTDRHGDLVKNHNVFLSVGHDEYWSGDERTAVEEARDAGVNLAFLSGNEVYWKTRWEPSQDGSDTGYRTLVCYKETWDNAKSDPSDEWTGTWRDPRFSPPANGGRPENELTGTAYMSNSDDLAITVPSTFAQNRFWANTSVAALTSGTATLAEHTIGYESDEDLDNGFRPAGLIRLSETTGETPEYLRDFGNLVTPDTTTHHMTLYRAASGALVFGAGTIQYAWALDTEHDSRWSPTEPVDKALQQATINLLADMDAQPATLMSGMVAASASTDGTGPSAAITSPTASASVTSGTLLTVSGTATDTGGGVVAGVEVSLDGGTSWHPASGTASWTYTAAVTGEGTATIKVRASDDSANVGATVTRTVALTGTTSLFGNEVPKTPDSGDDNATELGVKVVPAADGYIKGVRFYKGTGNTGTHKGTLWSADGDQLATGTFSSETATGWQTLTFDTPVPVVKDTTYVASYTAPNGHYAAQSWAFSYRGITAPPLSAPRSLGDEGNGVFGSVGQFPTDTYDDTNYYVDVLFSTSDSTPPTVTAVTPTPDVLYAPVTTAPTATFSKPVTASTVHFTVTGASGTAIAGATTYDSDTRKAKFTPSASLPTGQKITVAVTATDTDGNAMTEARTWSFTTSPYANPVGGLFADSDTPGIAAVTDGAGISLGVRFSASESGVVVGVRFYKGSGNGGTHTGSIWSSTGTRLATATFVNESSSGWQYVYFSSPLTVTAGTSYIASYYAPNGYYATTSSYFGSAKSNGSLTAPAGNNGLFVYGGDWFPSNSWNSTNYWVDPLFVAQAASDPTLPEGATTMFASSSTPTNPAWDDSGDVEVGMKFSSDVAGTVNGLRFYKGTGNTGTHTGSLWSSSGVLLATGTFSDETSSGWQTLIFSTPVSITAGTSYVVSYRAPNGHYAVDVGGLSSAVVNAPLRTAAGAGAYLYGGGYPSNAVSHNYWVDVVFTPGS